MFLLCSHERKARATRRAELYEGEASQLLAALRECHHAVVAAQRVLRPASETYALNSALLLAIDLLAAKLTGDSGYFQANAAAPLYRGPEGQ